MRKNRALLGVVAVGLGLIGASVAAMTPA